MSVKQIKSLKNTRFNSKGKLVLTGKGITLITAMWQNVQTCNDISIGATCLNKVIVSFVLFVRKNKVDLTMVKFFIWKSTQIKPTAHFWHIYTLGMALISSQSRLVVTQNVFSQERSTDYRLRRKKTDMLWFREKFNANYHKGPWLLLTH